MILFIRNTILCLSIMSTYFANAQSVAKFVEKSKVSLRPVECDCNAAIKIPLGRHFIYGPTISPVGFGEEQEINSHVTNDKYFFEREINSSWYTFNILFEGEFIFDIIPQNPKDDYDFMLFKIEDNDFCNKIKNKLIQPVRTNFARTGKSDNYVTGLSSSSDVVFQAPGIGTHYSAALHVKKGEKYCLILNNINGYDGHEIHFKYESELIINGSIVNSSDEPINAKISLENSLGEELYSCITNNLGLYNLKVKLSNNEKYSLVIFNKDYHFDVKEINLDNINIENQTFQNSNTKLQKLSKNKSYEIGLINFYGDSPNYIKESVPSINALLRLMTLNPKMKIQIEGHVNDHDNSRSEDFNLSLSTERAMTIRNYLIMKGIDASRINAIGKGGDELLYKNPKSENEHKRNRRVEIKVISLD